MRKVPDRQAARVFDVVRLGDQAPFAGPPIIVAPRSRRASPRSAMTWLCVRSGELRLSWASCSSSVLYSRSATVKRRPQRHAFGTEEREFLLDAFDNAGEPVAPLVAARAPPAP